MQQTWNPDRYAKNGRFVSDLGMAVLEWLAPKPGERILDLGCGDGALAGKLAKFGCQVVGIDSSPEFVEAAKSKRLDARLMDAYDMRFDNEFDAVFSNAALHWMKRPDQVIDGVWRALKPGGRFVGELGGQGNIAAIEAALHAALARRGIDPDAVNPWYYPTVEEYRARLEKRGFRVKTISLFPRLTPLPTDIRGWLSTFAVSFISAPPASERDAFINEVVEKLRPSLCDASGKWTVDYVRLRFSAIKPMAQ